jgi:hypothetical protein
MAIHLVGSNYGAVPDGPSQKSIVILQNELAVQRSRTAALQRVIWVPDGTHSDHPAAAAFIDALHHDAEAQFGADLITGDLETLKGAVHAALKNIKRGAQAPSTEQSTAATGRKRIHVLCDARDRKDTIALLKLLKQSADVSLPIFAGDAAAVREANQSLLMECDAVILFYGAGDEAWKFHQQNELKRIRALRPERPLPAETIYLSSPITDDKDLLVGLHEPTLVNALSSFPDNEISGLLKKFTS